MFCSKCGTQNGQVKFCYKCGTPFQNLNTNPIPQNTNVNPNNDIQGNTQKVGNNSVQPIPNQEPIQQNDKKQKPKKDKRKKKFKIRYIFLALLLFIVGVLLYNWGTTLYLRHQMNQRIRLLEPTVVEKIYDSFESGKINEDTFILQLAYSKFDADRLNDEFRSTRKNEMTNAPHILDELQKHKESLSESTIKYVLEQYLYPDINFDTDASGNRRASKTNNLFGISEVYASSRGQILNKAVLSSDNNFIIWYTDTGSNSITDRKANELANTLVEAVQQIKREFGYDFRFEAINNINSGVGRNQRRVLEANGIDGSHLNTALSFYIYDFGEQANTLGYYVPGFLGGFEQFVVNLIGGLQRDDIGNVSVLPFSVIKPEYNDNDDEMKQTLIHELWHHYEKYICGNGSYLTSCPSGLLTVETVANLVAAVIIDARTSNNNLNRHLANYIERIEQSMTIWTGWGNPLFTFGYAYSKIVPNGMNIVLESPKHEDALEHLYNTAGQSRFREVMELLAENNITNGWGRNSMKTQIKPEPTRQLCNDLCKFYQSMDRLSKHHYYLSLSDYRDDTKVIISTNQDKNNQVSFLLLGEKRSGYGLISKEILNRDNQIELNLDDYSNYRNLAIVIVNSTMDLDLPHLVTSFSYTIEVIRELPELDFGIEVIDNCIQIDYDGLINSLITLYNVFGQIVNEIGQAFDSDTSEFMAELERNKAGLEEARHAPIKSMSICFITLASTGDKDQLHRDVRRYLYPFRLKVFDQREGAFRVTVQISANIRGDVKYAILSTDPSENFLILISVKQK